MDNPNHNKMYRLDFYEEIIGTLQELIEYDGMLIAQIGRFRVILPLEMEAVLYPLLSKRLSILHTDLIEKPYLFRVLENETIEVKTD